mgnify:CR=1 FL=1
MRHQVDDRDLLPRRVGLGRLYLYLFEVRDLLQLEGMRRAGERYDAGQHLVSGEHSVRARLTDATGAAPGCSALVFDGLSCRDESAQQSRGGCSATGAVSHFTTLTLLLPIFAWSLLEESCNTMRVYIWSS